MSEWPLLDGCTLQVTLYEKEFVLLHRKPIAAGEPASDLPILGKAILEEKFDFVEEVIATEVEICLKLNARFGSKSLGALQSLAMAHTTSPLGESRRCWRAPIYFSDHADDWGEVCRQTNLARDEAIERLLACRFRVAMYGFLPGFLYLSGLPAELQVRRKENPEKRTAANAFALGGKYAGIYSLPSPAGWNVIGHFGVSLLDTQRLPPLLLDPGDQLVLERIDHSKYQQLMQQPCSLEEYNGLVNGP